MKSANKVVCVYNMLALLLRQSIALTMLPHNEDRSIRNGTEYFEEVPLLAWNLMAKTSIISALNPQPRTAQLFPAGTID